MTSWIVKLVQKVLLLAILGVAGGLICATMVRFAPGFGVDERELDPGLSRSSVEAIRAEHLLNKGLFAYYGSYLSGLLHGDFGTSIFLRQPVGELLKERAPLTIREVLLGLLTAWVVASSLVLLAVRYPSWLLDSSTTAFTGFLIALPIAVVALICVYLHMPVFIGVALVTLPKLFRYQHNILAQTNAQPFVLAAQSRGVSRSRVLLRHVIPAARHPLTALFGVSVSMAFGAAIPLEALSDAPGVGQLAWQAALNRDLPLLTSITLFVTLLTVALNSFAGAARQEQP